jgi:hypothetical protein
MTAQGGGTAIGYVPQHFLLSRRRLVGATIAVSVYTNYVGDLDPRSVSLVQLHDFSRRGRLWRIPADLTGFGFDRYGQY